jgi:agmatinase
MNRTFLNAQREQLGERTNFAIVGAPIDTGAGHRPGARFGPDAIRDASYWGRAESMSDLQAFLAGVPTPLRPSIADWGNVRGSFGCVRHDVALQEFKELAAAAAGWSDCLVTLGGDHSVLVPALAAACRGRTDVVLVHFDAHVDVWPIEAGEVDHHANSLAASLRFVERAVTFGARGYGPSRDRLEWARTNGIDVVPRFSPNALPRGPVYLSIDLDVVDPAFAPGVGTPEPGGWTARELLDRVQAVAYRCELVGMDVVEVCPAYDPGGITAALANRCVMTAIQEWAFKHPTG